MTQGLTPSVGAYLGRGKMGYPTLRSLVNRAFTRSISSLLNFRYPSSPCSLPWGSRLNLINPRSHHLLKVLSEIGCFSASISKASFTPSSSFFISTCPDSSISGPPLFRFVILLSILASKCTLLTVYGQSVPSCLFPIDRLQVMS